MTAGRKRRVLTADDLLRRQEEPLEKRSKISSLLEFDDLNETNSDETLEEELENDELQRGEMRDRRNMVDEEGDDALVDGEGTDPSTSGESNFGFPIHMDGKDRFDLQRVKPRTIVPQRPPKPTGATFASLGVSAPLQASLAAMSIRTPTEVQAACIPPLLAGQ
jgi:ATP-dependent RNA helicase DDX49/DBP8